MIPNWIGAISYRIVREESLPASHFDLYFSSCVSEKRGVNSLRSEVWRCRLPDLTKAIPRKTGYSETMGIVGGVSNPAIESQSEAIERAIGDALTITLVQQLEDRASLILVKGPCFPKTLGRFLSLRMPSHITIVWVSKLHAGNTNVGEDVLVLSSVRKVSWDHEELLNGFIFPDHEPRWLIEFIDNGDRVEKTKMIRSVLEDVSEPFPRELRFCESTFVPADEASFIRSSRNYAPDWLTQNPPTDLVKPIPLAAKGPAIFEWTVDH